MATWARLTSAGFWGWDIDILSNEGSPLALTMVEQPTRHAWTERGARRKADRLLRRRAARDRRAVEVRVLTIGEVPPDPRPTSPPALPPPPGGWPKGSTRGSKARR